MPTVKVCPDCGVEFEPTNNRQKYCKPSHKQKAYTKRNPVETKTDRVIEAKGRRCTNCRSEKPGKRFAFWWDDWDRVEENMETAMVLCAWCVKSHNSQLAKERERFKKTELRAEGFPFIIPF